MKIEITNYNLIKYIFIINFGYIQIRIYYIVQIIQKKSTTIACQDQSSTVIVLLSLTHHSTCKQ